jgi:outer membrane protein assembly factor BamB
VRPKPIRPERFAWAFPEEPPDENHVAPVRNAPAVDSGGRIFLHLGDRLVGMEEENGRANICWEYVTGCRAPGSVVVAPDGSLRLHSSDGSLHGLSSAGKQLWMPATVGEPLGHAAPMVDDQGNTWVCAYSGGLIKVDTNGRVHKPGPFFRARQKLDAGGVIRQGVLYVGSEDGCLFAIRLDGEKGVNLWNHTAGQGQTGWYIHCTPALSDDGVLIVAGRDENLYGFRLDGEPVFKTPMPGQMLGSPVLDRFGHMYVGVSQAQRGQQARGLLICLDGNSHKIRWEYKAAGPVESTPVIGSDDTIYFGDNAGVIHAVDFRGTPQWTAQVEAPVRSAGAMVGPERVAFGLDNETLVVLKCSSRSLAEGGWPKLGRTLGQCGLA